MGERAHLVVERDTEGDPSLTVVGGDPVWWAASLHATALATNAALSWMWNDDEEASAMQAVADKSAALAPTDDAPSTTTPAPAPSANTDVPLAEPLPAPAPEPKPAPAPLPVPPKSAHSAPPATSTPITSTPLLEKPASQSQMTRADQAPPGLLPPAATADLAKRLLEKSSPSAPVKIPPDLRKQLAALPPDQSPFDWSSGEPVLKATAPKQPESFAPDLRPNSFGDASPQAMAEVSAQLAEHEAMTRHDKPLAERMANVHDAYKRREEARHDASGPVTQLVDDMTAEVPVVADKVGQEVIDDAGPSPGLTDVLAATATATAAEFVGAGITFPMQLVVHPINTVKGVATLPLEAYEQGRAAYNAPAGSDERWIKGSEAAKAFFSFAAVALGGVAGMKRLGTSLELRMRLQEASEAAARDAARESATRDARHADDQAFIHEWNNLKSGEVPVRTARPTTAAEIAASERAAAIREAAITDAAAAESARVNGRQVEVGQVGANRGESGGGRASENSHGERSSLKATVEESSERYMKGRPSSPLERTYDRMLDPLSFAYEVATRYRVHLRGSKGSVVILLDERLRGTSIAGRTKESEGGFVIRINPDMLENEGSLANTIAHELSHARDYQKGIEKPHGDSESVNDGSVYGSGNALEEYIRGNR